MAGNNGNLAWTWLHTMNMFPIHFFFFLPTYPPLQTVRFSEVLSILDFSKTFYLDFHLISLKTLFQCSQLKVEMYVPGGWALFHCILKIPISVSCKGCSPHTPTEMSED